jgi:shikimate dehydrogenase
MLHTDPEHGLTPGIDSATQLCAVIGNPVLHSLSPAMHNAAFAETRLNYVYLAFRVEDAGACLAGMRAMSGFRGLSVTIPHKMAVIEHLDELDPMAKKVGSVNTVTHEHGRLIGSSTDGPGTLRAFADAGVSLDDRRVLFVGSGGAVRAVAFAVAELTQCEEITILGRTPARVAMLVNDLRAKTPATINSGRLPEHLAEAMTAHDVVINGTPVGMHPHEDETPIPRETLRAGQIILDMVYRPYKTRLVREAEDAGCTTILGLEMLVNQAALQFEAWTGRPAPYAVMRNALVDALGRG